MDFKEAYSYASELCSRQERCSSHIKDKLTKFEIAHEVITQVIEKLKSGRFLDDTRYATYYTKDKYRFQKWGRIKISYHLKAKNLTAETISEALETIDEDEYVLNLQHLLDSAKRKSKEVSKYMRDAKIVKMAAAKGYEPNLIYKLIKIEPNDQSIED